MKAVTEKEMDLVTEEEIETEKRKLKKLRTVTKIKLTKLKGTINKTPPTTTEEIYIRIDKLNNIWTELEQIQYKINLLTDETEIEAEIQTSSDIEEMFIQIKVKLERLKGELTFNSQNNTDKTSTHVEASDSTNVHFTPYQDDESFTNYIKRLEVYLTLRNKTDTKHKVLLLLNTLSPMLHQKLCDLCAPDEPRNKSYEELVKILIDYVDPQPSIWARQHSFICKIQEQHESVTEYATDLRKLVSKCDFFCNCGKSIAENFLRLQFIRGLKDAEIRTRLLQDKQLTSFKEIYEIAKSIELSKEENKLMNPNKVELNQIKEGRQNKGRFTYSPQNTRRNNQRDTFAQLRGRCYRCGATSHRANECKFLSAVCNFCKKTGHIAKVCMRRSRGTDAKQVDESDRESEPYEINVINSNKTDKFLVDVKLENKLMTMEIDTGAALSSISYRDYKKLGLNNKISETSVVMKTYTGEIIKPRGVMFVQCQYKHEQFIGKLFVIEKNVDPIFGRDWMREVKLDWAEIKSLDSNNKLNLKELLNEFEDIFKKEIGAIPEYRVKLFLKDPKRAVFMKPRQVPFAIKHKVERELNRLEESGIITRVDRSDWGTPVVPVVKPDGGIRICADYRATLNKYIEDENFPIPRIDEIFSNMQGGKYFCTLDLSNAYLHMIMDDESALLQTLSTQVGLYKVNRLMFGVKVAPALWNKFMAKLLIGIKGVHSFFDDIIIQGSTIEETSRRLKEVFQRIREQNLRLNKEKCKFFKRSIKYLGHVIDEEGLHTSRDKVEALLNAAPPKNQSELRSLLGLVNYYNKFIPNLASIINPLNQLLKNNIKFVWTENCEACFKKIKEELTNKRTLHHFDQNLPLILATDASSKGLGAVISHRLKDGTEKPIAFASRSLTLAEQKYSQIDKEAVGIYWGLKKFYQYCYGRKFTLITDHKPLVSIFDPLRKLPTMTATRLFHYAQFLSGFDYSIEFRRTHEHSNADYFSRFPLDKVVPGWKDQSEEYQLNQLNALTVTKKSIKQATELDETLVNIRDRLIQGESLESTGYHDNEFTLQDGCLFRGCRIVIPERLKRNVLKELHIGHMGTQKMKLLARSFCYWKGIDRDIEDLVKSCKSCCQKQNNPPKENLHPWEETTKPWQRVHIDFAGPLYGQYYFIVVDSFSKWVEIIPTKNTTSSWCVKQLETLISTFGIPLAIVSDNGPQFKSQIFNKFIQDNEILHKTTAPYHPASNGQAERFVQTFKKMIRAMEGEKGTIDEKLKIITTRMRLMPNATGQSAYNLMFGRDIRTTLTLMKEDDGHMDTREKKYTGRRKLKEGERVQARSYNDKNIKWQFGKILSNEGNVMYRILMENGDVWKRHINQLRPSKLRGEN